MSNPVIIGDATLYHGDCLEILPTLPKVGAMVTDPPYFLPAAHYSVRSGSAKSIGDLSILGHYFADLFAAASAVIEPTGFAYVFCDGQSYPVFYATAYPYFKRTRPLVWDKQTSINGYAWRHQHELVMFCEMVDSPAIPTGDGDVLKFRAEPIEARRHLAQKPEDLMRALIRKTAETVLDPFMGSGTTGVACANLGRKFIGIEIERKYFDIACERIDNAYRQARMFA